MFCGKCGTKIEDTAEFCSECGEPARINNKVDHSEQNQQEYNYGGQQQNNYGGGNNIMPMIITLISVMIVCTTAIVIMVMKPWEKSYTVDYDIAGNNEEIVDTTPTPNPTLTPTPTPSKAPQREHTYSAVKADVTWWQAVDGSYAEGGHLVSINSADEFYRVTSLAEENGIKVLWVGARRNGEASWSSVKWVTGEPLSYTKWYTDEPSYHDKDGTVEDVLALQNINGTWYFNDTPDNVTKYYAGRIGYVIEKE